MDALGRMVFDRLSQSMGQPFVIDDRPWASGNIGLESVAPGAGSLRPRIAACLLC